MTGKRPIYSAFVSDIHLGNRRTSAEHIVNNLREAFPNNAETGKLDIIFLVGDVFDSILTLPAEDVFIIQLWIHDLLKMCVQWDIVLVVLEGTPSHDRKQSKEFIRINAMLDKPALCYYQDILSILHLDKWDIDILCIPDEWRPTPEQTWEDVKALLKQHDLKAVDFTIMHGMFEYQLPRHVKLACHKEDHYLNITRYYISIGHYHIMSRYDRIFAQGSFDRLAHGEEEPKGHIRVTVYGDKAETTDKVEFIKNLNAKLYKTFTVDKDNVQAVLSAVCKLPIDSYVSFKTDRDTELLVTLNQFKKTHTEYHCKIVTDGAKQDAAETIRFATQFKAIDINPSNIKTLLIGRMKENHVEGSAIALAENLLTSLVEGGN